MKVKVDSGRVFRVAARGIQLAIGLGLAASIVQAQAGPPLSRDGIGPIYFDESRD
jgi:hypothetical protein